MKQHGRSINMWPAMMACCGLLAWMAVLLSVCRLTNQTAEMPLMLWIHHHTDTWLIPLVMVLHVLGKMVVAVPLITVWVAYGLLIGRRSEAVFLGLSTLVSVLMMFGVKALCERPRPHFWPQIIEETHSSFPSGHSTFAAAVATVVILIWLHSPYRRMIFLTAVCFAALMGWSRIYLGVHYPTDVLAGWMNGMLSTLILYYFFFRERFVK